MVKQAPGYLNLTKSAKYLGIGVSTMKRIWPELKEKYGLVPSRFPGRNLTYKISALDDFMEKMRVQ